LEGGYLEDLEEDGKILELMLQECFQDVNLIEVPLYRVQWRAVILAIFSPKVTALLRYPHHMCIALNSHKPAFSTFLPGVIMLSCF
jgi:hypothetical protein